MNMPASFSRLCHSPIARIAAVILVALACGTGCVSSPSVHRSEIEAAAQQGDVRKIKSLLKDNPDLVFSKDTSGFTPLHVAASAHHKDVAELLLANGADVHANRDGGKTPLHWAAATHAKDVAELLLANGADVNANGDGGKTPLHWAAMTGDKQMAQLLLANKAEVDAKSKDGWTPLRWAAARGNKDMVQTLLEAGANPNITMTDGKTALDAARLGKHAEVTEILTKAGAKYSNDLASTSSVTNAPTAQVTNALTPQPTTSADVSAAIDAWRLEMAYVKANRPRRVNGFLTGSIVGSSKAQLGTIKVKKTQSNIDSDAFTCTPAHPIGAGEEGWSAFVTDNQALSMSNVQMGQFAYPIVAMVKTSDGRVFTIVPAILKAKIDINAGAGLHSKGYTVETKRPVKAGDEIAVLLVGDNILSVEELEEAKESSEVKPWLIIFPDTFVESSQHGGKATTTNDTTIQEAVRSLDAPLLKAARAGDTAAVQLLLQKGANVNAAGTNSASSLFLASEGDHADVVKLLLAAGANVNAITNLGATALVAASQNGHADVVKLLLAATANVDTARNDSATALMMASQYGHAEVVKLLLAAHGNVNQISTSGVMPLMLASGKGHAYVVKLLLAAGANVNAATNNGATALSLASEERHAEVVQLLKAAGAVK